MHPNTNTARMLAEMDSDSCTVTASNASRELQQGVYRILNFTTSMSCDLSGGDEKSIIDEIFFSVDCPPYIFQSLHSLPRTWWLESAVGDSTPRGWIQHPEHTEWHFHHNRG
ncbi:hypothetical protein HGRIS_011027 [Hohenbuehelia grisea]|uniref:Uncharacterized protein n=1 Tax=Hohenbuehelia grisea TaxID=104357 RepID=A0ABR3IYK5_9AGAR